MFVLYLGEKGLRDSTFTQSIVDDSNNSIFRRLALGNASTEYLVGRQDWQIALFVVTMGF